LVAIYPLNVVDKASDRRNDSSLVSILESTDLMKFRVLIHCMQCLNVAVVACLTMLLELDNINNNAIERAASLVSSRTLTDVFFHLALDARNARICPLFTFPIGGYCKACSRVFEMLDSRIAWMAKQLMGFHRSDNLRSFLLA
jgi:hypothetical protein